VECCLLGLYPTYKYINTINKAFFSQNKLFCKEPNFHWKKIILSFAATKFTEQRKLPENVHFQSLGGAPLPSPQQGTLNR